MLDSAPSWLCVDAPPHPHGKAATSRRSTNSAAVPQSLPSLFLYNPTQEVHAVVRSEQLSPLKLSAPLQATWMMDLVCAKVLPC